MIEKIKLSQLLTEIQDTIQDRFEAETFWVTTQITNVKRQESDRRCYLTLEEYENGRKTAEIRAVFWSNTYNEIEKFEKLTKQVFKAGIEITCRVKIRFHKIYGLNADVIQIDVAHTLGSLELQRQETLERLVKENPKTIQLFDGVYHTYNKRLSLPLVIQNIALITPPNSDGQRDFQQELNNNKHNYTFRVKEFLTTIQGDHAHQFILDQLKQIENSTEKFDAVAIVRGGGSQTDFKPFDDYTLASYVAGFKIPIFTGIGHDRNQSIVDLMAREQKTPTKVAALFIEHNFEFENRLIALKTQLYDASRALIEDAKAALKNMKRIVTLSSPEAILDRGFAMIKIGDQIISDPKMISEKAQIQTILKDEIIHSTVTKKTKK